MASRTMNFTHLLCTLLLSLIAHAAHAEHASSPPNSVTVRTSQSPQRGPLPSEVTPVVPDSIPRVSIPIIPPTCARPGSPVVTIVDGGFDPFNFNLIDYSVGSNVDWCSETGNSLRFRLLKFSRVQQPDGTFVVSTVVLGASVENFLDGSHFFIIQRECTDIEVYAEYCGRRSRTRELVCGTSEFFTVPRQGIPEPQLKFRPPIRLDLAPGDSARVFTRTGPVSPGSGFGGFQQNGSYALQGFVIDKNGQLIGETNARVSQKMRTSLLTRVPLDGGGVTLRDDGNIVYANYSLSSCLTAQGTWRERYPTEISVSRSHKSLIKQDVRLPNFRRKPKYPPSMVGDTVVLSVDAFNRGGGVREGGMPTELTYQWYVTDFTSFQAPTYPEPVPGANDPSITVTATCQSCMRNGCFNSGIYTVDVCNTFGCRRSDDLVPDIILPSPRPGFLLNPFTCMLE